MQRSTMCRMCLFFLVCALFAKGTKEKLDTSGKENLESSQASPTIQETPKIYSYVFDKTMPDFDIIQEGFEDAARDFGFVHNLDDIDEIQKDELSFFMKIQAEESSGVTLLSEYFNQNKEFMVKNENITAINLWKNPSANEYRSVITVDSEKIGREIMQAVYKICEGKGDVIVLKPSVTLNICTEIEKWIYTEYAENHAKYKNISLVKSALVKEKTSTAIPEIKAAIRTYPNIKVLISLYPPDIPVICQFIEEKKLINLLSVTGIAQPTLVEDFVAKGIVPFFFAWNVHDFGYLAGYVNHFFSLNTVQAFSERSILVNRLGLIDIKKQSEQSFLFFVPLRFCTRDTMDVWKNQLQ